MNIKSLAILSVCASALISVGCVAFKSLRIDKDEVEEKEIDEHLSKEEKSTQSHQSQESHQSHQSQESHQSHQSEVAIQYENQVKENVEIEQDSYRSSSIEQKSIQSSMEKLESKETSSLYALEKKVEKSNIQLERVEESIEKPELEEKIINTHRDTQVLGLLTQAEDLKKKKENEYLKSSNSDIKQQLKLEREVNHLLRTQLKSSHNYNQNYNNNNNRNNDNNISTLTNSIGQNSNNNNNIPNINNKNNSMGLNAVKGLPKVSAVESPSQSSVPVPSSLPVQSLVPVPSDPAPLVPVPLVPVPASVPVPPPVPPVNGFKKSQSSIQCRPPPIVPKPVHPLKALHWTKLPAAKVNESLFVKLGPMNNINLPWESIENEFAAKVIIREKKEKGPSQVVDTKLSNNIGIFLSQFRAASTKQLIQWIQNMDEQQLSRDQLKQMSKLLPSQEDIAALKQFLQAEDRSKLSIADQYCLDISALPFAGEKISMFLLKCELESRLEEVEKQIGVVSLACEEIIKSNKLLRIIEIVLVLGNFINYGTPRGGQSGFKIDTLCKLGDSRSSDLTSNLVNILVNYCTQNEPQLLTFADEMKSLGTARKTIWSGVVADVTSIAVDVNGVKEMVGNLQKSKEPFNQSILQFLTSATSEVERMKKNLESAQETFKKLCTFFAEDSSQIQPEELFDIIGRFITLFENGTTYLQLQNETKEKEVKRQQRLQRLIS